jgi:hypothetical protein
MSKLGKQILARIRARREPGRVRLERFCNAVEAGEQPDQETLAELAALLRAVLDDPEPESKVLNALGLSKPRQRPRKNTLAAASFAVQLAYDVERRIMEIEGEPNAKEQAIRDVAAARLGGKSAQDRNTNRQRVRRAYNQHRGLLAAQLRLERAAIDMEKRLAELEAEEREEQRRRLYEGGLID